MRYCEAPYRYMFSLLFYNPARLLIVQRKTAHYRITPSAVVYLQHASARRGQCRLEPVWRLDALQPGQIIPELDH